jgi:hypothetical protein
MRPSRVIAALLFAAAIGTPALLAVPAWAASPTPPVAVHASPNPVLAGHTVTVSGSVGPDQAGSECATGVKLLSRAFNSNQDFAGVPALGATVRPDGTFTATTTIPRSKAAGSYAITGRCGGGNLGVSATLVVRAAATTPPIALRVSPSSVAAGGSVTVSGSLGPESAAGSECASGVTLLSRAFVHTQDFAGMPAVGATVRRDGTFQATITIPRSRAAGSYTITGRCGGNLGVSATLVVRAPASPTTTPAPVPPPATGPTVTAPAVSAPAITGPPTQPATPAAAHLASRWIIPGLVALGSGTLAALGVWALYRRRHPPGSSRQGRSPMAH